MLRPSFTEHPASVGETYGEHFRSACNFSASMISGGLACFVHAIFPFLFASTGSFTVRRLYERMVASRTRQSAIESYPASPKSSEVSPADDGARKVALVENGPASE
jgi:Family of unknown function (DUF6356)